MSETCSNLGFYDRWTCPECYNELGDVPKARTKSAIIKCDSCGKNVRCSLEYEPSCRSTIVLDGEEEDDNEV